MGEDIFMGLTREEVAEKKPTRCIDPVIKFCQECGWGWTHYPEWVETYEDLFLPGCTIESGCTLGFDQGRPEDEPTEEELMEYEEWVKELYRDDIRHGNNDDGCNTNEDIESII